MLASTNFIEIFFFVLTLSSEPLSLSKEKLSALNQFSDSFKRFKRATSETSAIFEAFALTVVSRKEYPQAMCSNKVRIRFSSDEKFLNFLTIALVSLANSFQFSGNNDSKTCQFSSKSTSINTTPFHIRRECIKF